MADNNIIFIGMPAVGKSTVGVVIAKRLGYRPGQCTGESGTYRYLAGRQRSIL